MKKIFGVIAAIFICQAAGIFGALFTAPAMDSSWYDNIVKPVFNPPGWIFGPVWTILYTLMGVALYLLWQSSRTRERTLALTWFGIQLALNVLWTPIFFGWHNLALAYFEIIALDIAVVITMFYARRVSRPSVYLLLPYLAWILFATVLSLSLWRLN